MSNQVTAPFSHASSGSSLFRLAWYRAYPTNKVLAERAKLSSYETRTMWDICHVDTRADGMVVEGLSHLHIAWVFTSFSVYRQYKELFQGELIPSEQKCFLVCRWRLRLYSELLCHDTAVSVQGSHAASIRMHKRQKKSKTVFKLCWKIVLVLFK